MPSKHSLANASEAATQATKKPLLARIDSDILASFLTTPSAIFAAVLGAILIFCAVFAPWIAPFDPLDPSQIDLFNANLPPVFVEGSDSQFILGTDNQGRDLLSALLHGTRISLTVGLLAVLFSVVMGVLLGLVAGYFGGLLDIIIMRAADVQLSIPAILVALLIDGVLDILLPGQGRTSTALIVIIIAIGISGWVQYARVVRSSVMSEKVKEYVQACQVIGLGTIAILFRHILPNVLGPVFVLGTIHLAVAIIIEATLSFLGVGLPLTTPSLGTLVRIGNEYLFSGEWWVTIFPGLVLLLLALSINLLGDWLREALNPKLR